MRLVKWRKNKKIFFARNKWCVCVCVCVREKERESKIRDLMDQFNKADFGVPR